MILLHHLMTELVKFFIKLGSKEKKLNNGIREEVILKRVKLQKTEKSKLKLKLPKESSKLNTLSMASSNSKTKTNAKAHSRSVSNKLNSNRNSNTNKYTNKQTNTNTNTNKIISKGDIGKMPHRKDENTRKVSKTDKKSVNEDKPKTSKSSKTKSVEVQTEDISKSTTILDNKSIAISPKEDKPKSNKSSAKQLLQEQNIKIKKENQKVKEEYNNSIIKRSNALNSNNSNKIHNHDLNKSLSTPSSSGDGNTNQNANSNPSALDSTSIVDKNFLPCRESEQKEIYNYIKNGLKTDGGYSSLYISGMPGTGKTESVKTTLNILKKERENKSLTNFNILEINAMKIPNTNTIFKLFYNLIFKSDTKKEPGVLKCVGILDEYFRTRNSYSDYDLVDPSKPHIIVLLDEIDALLTTKQSELYNIFNWTTYNNSGLIIVTISNNLDLPDHFIPKIRSRSGNNRLVFQPYKFEQLLKILRHKISNINQYHEDALNFCCKKVAALNGDLRRIIQTCRRSEEIFNKTSRTKDEKISIKIVLQAYKDLFDSKIINLFQNLKIYEKVIIISLLYELKNSNICNKANVLNVFKRQTMFLPIVNKNILEKRVRDEIEPISFDSFQQIVYNLSKVGLIKLNDCNNSNFQENYMMIKFYPDEFSHAMNDDSLVGNIVNDYLIYIG